MKGRFRVKLVMPSGPDAHYWYADTLPEADEIVATLREEIPVPASLYVYVETSLGHVRIK